MTDKKKEYRKYGLLFAVAWNILMFTILAITNYIQGYDLFYMESVHWYDMPSIVMICTLAWYWIGYSLRRQFLEQRNYYLQKYQAVNPQKAGELFKFYYWSRYSKILTFVCITAIPWYIIGYVREGISPTNFVVVGILFLLSVVLFLITLQLKRIIKSRDL